MAETFVPAWIGANRPGEHDAAYGSPGLAVEALRNEDDKWIDQGYPDGVQRVYRPGGSSTAMQGNQVALAASNPAAVRADEKLAPGAPNYVGNELPTGQAFGPDDMALSPIPQDASNVRLDVTPNYSGPIGQPRAGSTSADNTRQSQRQNTFLVRPFDKLISEHPDALGRVMSPPPFAARPRVLATDIGGAFPSAGGHESTVGRGPGSLVNAQPNTIRLLPNAWDTNLTNDGGPAASTDVDPAQTAAARQAAVGWRAR